MYHVTVRACTNCILSGLVLDYHDVPAREPERKRLARGSKRLHKDSDKERQQGEGGRGRERESQREREDAERGTEWDGDREM